ncbi:Leader peptidase (Prepilin peptidase) / N-methyltransferase [hydrothermal vent metagenome]|uniref:Leader peptidase (Prepilin peptidase) / N-methyltransferase n=1 Tax=hydrothermal vent metagenome TaxID=652676 RepID=A0A3B1C2M1_9ZZZZ
MTEIPALSISVFSVLLGLCVGSFLNVVIYRMPMGMSVVSPGSQCPRCGSPIRGIDNIPLISWLLLLGLCRDCGARISPRYFFVELLTGAVTWLIVNKFGLNIETGLYLIFGWGLVAITFIDIDFQIIPDELSVGGIMLGLLVSPLLPIGLKGAFIGVLVGGGLFYLLAIIYPGGMGGGDIKLIAAIGAFTGWQLTLLTIMLSSILGSIVGIGAMAILGKSRKDKIPFGPFLAVGGFIALLWGEDLIRLYLDTLM